MALRRRLSSRKEDGALPMCSNGELRAPLPPPPMRQSSDGAIDHRHTGSVDMRNTSITTSMPSVYETQTVSHLPIRSLSLWTSTSQSSSYGESMDAFLAGKNGYEEEYVYPKSKRIPQAHLNMLICVAVALFLLPWAGHQAILYRWRRLSNAVEVLKREHENILQTIDKRTGKVRELEETLTTFESENHKMLRELHLSGDVYIPDDSSKYDEMSEYEEGLLNRITLLKSKIQEQSRLEVQKRYGNGPYRVEITLREETLDTSDLIDNKFVIEMAPLDIMPHSVNHFLKMVSKKLWDGLSFVHRDVHSHVLQATPLDVKKAERVDKRFYEANLGKLSFAEYSKKYPHKAYTVGFAGRPGGPDFYVNTVDNSVSHGPLDHHEVDEGESCFGTVISGRDVLDKLLIGGEDSARIKLGVIETIRML